MLDGDEFRRLLDFMQQPVFIVRRSGVIETANSSARAVLGPDLADRNLSEFTPTPPDVLDTYLRRCSGSGTPVVASLVLRNGAGSPHRYQVKGALLSRRQERAADRIILRCSDTAFREFTRMSRQVEELNRENRKQRHSRALLKEALDQRDLLLREVQHRVRNHTQMMLSMVSGARREARGEELSVFLDALRRRLMAIATVQQLMYTSARLEALPARQLIGELCSSIAETWPPGADLKVECVDVTLANDVAVPLALIINELLSNALKHGLNFGPGSARVQLSEDGHDLVLSVWDSGPGLATRGDGESRTSGLSMVRGMCRQIGGSFACTVEGGTCCKVRFPCPVRVQD